MLSSDFFGTISFVLVLPPKPPDAEYFTSPEFVAKVRLVVPP